MSEIAAALLHVRERIATAAAKANRSADEITLVAVSKTFPAEAVADAIAAGQRDFGENRVEEALPKMDQVAAQANWHLIGHVQSRKARDATNHFALIHSVDSLRLATKISERSRAIQPILLQCNVSGEVSKEGFDLQAWQTDRARLDAFVNEVAQIMALPNIRVDGLMTIAPLAPDATMQHNLARSTFASLRELRDMLKKQFPASGWSQLSMGMSDDLEGAIAEGSTMVRVGRAIFGSRTYV